MGESVYYNDEKIMNTESGKIMLLKVFPKFSMQKKKASQRHTLLTGVAAEHGLSCHGDASLDCEM